MSSRKIKDDHLDKHMDKIKEYEKLKKELEKESKKKWINKLILIWLPIFLIDLIKLWLGFYLLLIRALIIREWSDYLIEVGKYDEILLKCGENKPHTYFDAVKELVDLG